MSSTSFIKADIPIKNMTVINNERWFIPLNIFMGLCSVLTITIALFSLFIIILDRTCHTTVMIFVFNSFLSAIMIGCVTLSMSIFTFENDLKQIEYEDSLCLIRAYIGYGSYCVLNFSFLLQSLYRYIIVVYPNRLFYQSIRFHILLICLTWIYAFMYPLPVKIAGSIVYNVDNQICQLYLEFSFFIIYGAICAYTIPMLLIIFIYFKLVRYVKEMSKNARVSNSLVRAKQELKMVRRIVIVIMILVSAAFPYMAIMFMSFFTIPPKYHFRIIYAFFDASILLVMFSLFQFTDPLRTSVIRKINIRSNVVIPTVT